MEAGPAKEAILRVALVLGTVCRMVLSTDALLVHSLVLCRFNSLKLMNALAGVGEVVAAAA